MKNTLSAKLKQQVQQTQSEQKEAADKKEREAAAEDEEIVDELVEGANPFGLGGSGLFGGWMDD